MAGKLASLVSSDSRKKILGNLTWLMADKAVSLLDAFVVGALVARYLGPSGIGVLASALASVALAIIFVTMGMDGIILREFVRHTDRVGIIFWSLACLRWVLGCLMFLAFAIFVMLDGNNDGMNQSESVLLIVAAGLLFSPSTVLKPLLDSKTSAKWYVVVNNSVLLVTSVIKWSFVLFSMSIIAFAWLHVASSIVAAAILFLLMWNRGLIPPIHWPAWSVMKGFVAECWPLFVATLSVGLCMSADVLMIQWLRDDSEAGIYSVATRLSSVWFFIPIVLATTFQPSLTRMHGSDPARYLQNLQWQFDVHVLAAMACVLFAVTCFPSLIGFLYGDSYSASIPIFFTHIWAVPFVFIGVARNQHLSLESFHYFNMMSAVAGAVFNVGLNLMIIPAYGGQGAAVATVISHGVTAYFSTFLPKAVRPIAVMQTRAFVSAPWRLYRQPVV